ncbi:IPT/TIG domain-containing protein [Mucilaginibacter ximonensis]|uniref:IPT/TIG domain-containing protein n=1 Tax=Mucilaginibacter ximonensis TaxID=538021 RepID=A0ABW5YGA9_9SPHI
MIKKPLLTIGGLMLLIAVMGSCKKDTVSTAPTTTTTVPQTNFSGVVDGRTLSLSESSMSAVYYATDGDATKALLSTNTLSSAGDQLVLYIADVKAGTQTLTKKLGTSSNPGSPSLRVNGTSAVSTTTQTYIRYKTTGGNLFYAISGTIDITIDGNNITIKWDIKFMNPTSGEFPSKGSLTILNYTANKKAKSEIVDPTPQTIAPTIESITPLIGTAGDTVTIKGVNYSTTMAENIVNFGGSTPARLLQVTSTTIRAIVPKQGYTGAITIKIKNSDLCTGPTFTYISPVAVTSYAPLAIKIGDTVTIKGANFSTKASDNVVSFNNGAGYAQVIAATASQLSVVVPSGATTGRITVSIGSHSAKTSTDIVVANSLAWQSVNFNGSISNYNQAATLGTKTIFAGGLKSTYLYLTTDGSNFTNVYNNLPFNKTALEIRLVAANDSALFVTSNYGVAKSKDGVTWTQLVPNPNNPTMGFTGIVALGNTVNLVNGTTLYTSTDGGKTFTNTFVPSLNGLDYITSDAAGKYWYAVDAAGNLPNAAAKKFYRSTDQGKTWVATKGTTGYYLYGFGQQEYLKAHSTAGVFVLYTPPSTSPSLADQRLYKSTNQGDSWSRVNDEATYVVKVTGSEVMYAGLTFNLSKDGSNYTKYLAPAGYTIYGAEKSNGYYYIFATNNTTSARRIFRAAIQ